LSSVPQGLWPSLGDTRIKAILPMAGDAYPFGAAGLASITVPVMAMGGTADWGTPFHLGPADE
jgi:predicted dienelactone hydrolase